MLSITITTNSIEYTNEKCALESSRELCTVCKWVSASALATVLCQPFPSNKKSDSIRILSKRYKVHSQGIINKNVLTGNIEYSNIGS